MIFGRIAHLQNTSFNVAHLAAPIASLLLELSWRKTSCADFLGGGSMGNPSSMLSDVNVSPIWQHPLFPYLFGGGGGFINLDVAILCMINVPFTSFGFGLDVTHISTHPNVEVETTTMHDYAFLRTSGTCLPNY